MKVLELASVSFSRSGRPVLDGVDLELAAGELRLLVGSSGAGKTTLLRLVAGFEAPETGTIALAGRLASVPGEVRIAPHARGVAMAFQDQALWPHRSALAHLLFGRCAGLGSAEAREKAVEILARVGLAGRENARPGELSGGERQRLEIARALAQAPRVLLLDEPLAHIDLGARRALAREIVAWGRLHEVAILWVTHHPDELAFVEGRASLLASGKLERPFPSRDLERRLAQEEA